MGTIEMMSATNARTVLALNSGSSSLKFGLYRVAESTVETLLTGEADAIGASFSRFVTRDARGTVVSSSSVPIADRRAAMKLLVDALAGAGTPAPDAVGHRIVHGGPALRRDCRIDTSVLDKIKTAAVFAPLHTDVALSVITAAMETFPTVAHVACFDTSFHADMPERARVLPIPGAYKLDGIQRYGFHGLSCESIVRQCATPLPERMIIAHLGSGSSVTAVRAGRSIDTSMGLTPTGGVIMGTRSGDLDPGVLLYFLREKNWDGRALDAMLQRESGLLGISGVSNDMRQLRAAAESNADAKLAIEMFCVSVAKQIAAMIATLDGVDALVFAGGIGENDAQTRRAICQQLRWIGVHLDDGLNAVNARTISEASSRCTVHVLPSEENQEIARHTVAITR